MRILAINGSHRKHGGLNQLMIDALFAGARAAGGETECIRLAEKKILPCTSCEKCQRKSGYGCINDDKDDFDSITKMIREADVVILATPVYIFQMSSHMKAFIERFYSRGKSHVLRFSRSGLIFHDIDHSLMSKAFVALIVSRNIETKTTANLRQYFQYYSEFNDAPMVGCLVRNGGYILTETESKLDNREKTCRKRILEALDRSGHELVTAGIISRATERAVSQNILPMPRIVFKLVKHTPFGKKFILQKSMDLTNE